MSKRERGFETYREREREGNREDEGGNFAERVCTKKPTNAVPKPQNNSLNHLFLGLIAGGAYEEIFVGRSQPCRGYL
jgi:hypothetical protein